MKKEFLSCLRLVPIVASVKDEAGLREALKSECEIIFVLYGDLCSIGKIVNIIKANKKIAIVHIDLIEGLANREIAVKYIKENTLADGIISTKSGIIKAAKEIGLIAIQRFFVIDSIALKNFEKQVGNGYADAVEILPAVIPKIIKRIVSSHVIPIIIGGLISDKEDVMTGLESGAVAVSSTNPKIWFLL